MQCHRCKHYAACLSCRAGGEDAGLSNDGQNFVSLDAMPNPGGILRRQSPQEPARAGYDFERADIPSDPEDAAAVFRDALVGIFTLKEQELLLVRHVFCGGSMAGFARAHGISRQRVNQIEESILASRPMFASLFSKAVGRSEVAPKEDGGQMVIDFGLACEQTVTKGRARRIEQPYLRKGD